MTALNTMSWVIGLANPTSALLVGPFLGRLLGSRYTRRAQGFGWLLLAVAQAAFLLFGFVSGFPGFKFAQPWMVPIALANFVVWVRQNQRQEAPSG